MVVVVIIPATNAVTAHMVKPVIGNDLWDANDLQVDMIARKILNILSSLSSPEVDMS